MPDYSEIKHLDVKCGGGLHLDVSSLLADPGSAIQLQNYEPSISGGYRRISGFAEWDSTAVSGSGQITGIYNLDSNVIACRGANVEYSAGSGWTSITSGRTGAGKYHFDSFNFDGTDKIVMVSGLGSTSSNPAATWDGTNYTLLNASNAPANPSHVAVFKEHLFLNENEVLYFSAPYDETDWTVANGAGSIRVPDQIITLRMFRNALYIFCRDSIFKLIGDSIASWELQPVTDKVGCLTCLSVQELNGELVFLSPNGLRTVAATERIGDTELGTLSQPIHNRFISINDDTNICSTVIRDKNQYRIWFNDDSDTTAEAKGVIGAIPNHPTSEHKWEFSDMRGIKPTYAHSAVIGRVEYVFHGDYSDGKIYQQETGTSFGGSDIEAIYKSPDIIVDDMGLRKMLQRVILNMEYEGTISTDMFLIYDANDLTIAQPAKYEIDETAGAVYGTAIYGTDKYSTAGSLIVRKSVEGSGFTVALKLYSNGTDVSHTLKSFQIEYSPGGRR